MQGTHPEQLEHAGREWLKGLHKEDPEMVPHELPSEAALRDMVADLPLQVESVVDEKSMYLAVLRVPPGYRVDHGPLRLQVRRRRSRACTRAAWHVTSCVAERQVGNA